jgi:hypothetical protein
MTKENNKIYIKREYIRETSKHTTAAIFYSACPRVC